MNNEEISNKIKELKAESKKLSSWQKSLEQQSFGLKLREESDNRWAVDRELWFHRGQHGNGANIKTVAIALLCIPLFISILVLVITVKNIITFDMALDKILEDDSGIVVYNNELGAEYVLQLSNNESDYDFKITDMSNPSDSKRYIILSSRQIGYSNIDRHAEICFINNKIDTNATYVNEKYLVISKDGAKYYGFNIKEARKLKEEIYKDNGK